MRLTAENLTSERGERLVFEGLSFTVGEGELLAIVGPNGSGKSTLLRILAGLLPETAGTISLEPKPDLSRGGLMHYLGHRDGLKQAMSVRENLDFWQKIFADPGLPPIDALDRVRLGHLIDLPTSYLSAGQRRRVAIARLLAVRRPIWLLDEPTSALDAASEGDLGAIMAEHLRDGGTIIAATHLTLPVPNVRRLDLGSAAMSAFFAIIRQTVTLSFRVGGGALIGLIFFMSVLVVVPFAVGPDLNLLARIGPAILWIGALLATLLGLDRLFQDDRDDGSLDQLILTDIPLPALVLAKAIGHWVATGLPLVVAAPVLALFLNLEPYAIGIVTLTLLVGTPAITLIGTVGAAVMVALRKGGLLVAVLVIPFTIPVLIFGVGASMTAITGPAPFLPPFLFMSAVTLLSLIVGPVAGALAIRAAQE